MFTYVAKAILWKLFVMLTYVAISTKIPTKIVKSISKHINDNAHDVSHRLALAKAPTNMFQ